MNSLVGKSTGIALLMAAALLAALLAMGVFGPGGADAAVKSGVEAKVTKNGVETYTPAVEGVTLTVTFEVNDDVDGAPLGGTTDDVVITLVGNPFNLATAPIMLGNITATQGGVEVGGVQYVAGQLSITLTEAPAADAEGVLADPPTVKGVGNPMLRENTPTTLTITGLTNGVAGLKTVQVHQQPQDSGTNGKSDTFTIGPSVTSASVRMSSLASYREASNGTPARGDKVTMTIKFRTDTANDEADEDDDVVITLPGAYDLDEGNDSSLDTGISVEESGTANSLVSADGTMITVNTFGANTDVTITIKGLRNPSTSEALDVKFKQGIIPAGADMGIQQIEQIYITNPADVAISNLEIDEPDAGGVGSLSFDFVALPIGDDESIRIEFATGYIISEPEVDEGDDPVANMGVTVVQKDAANNDAEVALVFTVTTDDPETDVEERSVIEIEGAMFPLRNIYVAVPSLENSDTVGLVANAVTVRQGTHPVATANARQTGTQISSTEAGKTIRIRVSTLADAVIPPGEDIRVDLEGFVLPEEIDEDQVILDGGEKPATITDPDEPGRYYGPPSSISIDSGRWVTLSIPTSYPNGNPVNYGVPPNNIYTITFKVGAGVKNPTVVRGARPVEADDQAITNTATDVTSKVSATNAEKASRKANASRGDRVTFSVVGLKAGSATLYLKQGDCIDAAQAADGCVDETGAAVLDAAGDPVSEASNWEDEDDDFRIGNGPQEGGKVSVVRRVTSSLFEANQYGVGPREEVNDKLVGTNIIYSVDGTGLRSDAHGRLAIEPTVELGTESIKQGGLLELEITDWYYGQITGIEVGGVPVEYRWAGGGRVNWTPQGVTDGERDDLIVVMPPGVRLGDQQLKLIGSTLERQAPASAADSFTSTITVDPLDLEISPVNDDGNPEVVINQEFTIEGRGFNTETGACILSVKFGDVYLDETTAGVDVDCTDNAGLKPDTAGNFSATFRLEPGTFGVPDLRIGEYRVEVKDNEERVGVVDVLIPEPVVTVTPEASRRGSTVTVVGSKFPASSELAVEIKYGLAGNERTITAATPDSAGNWRETFVIPTTAVIGEDHVVVAAPISGQFSRFKGKGTHRLPEQELIVRPGRVAAGGRMNLEGHNMPLFTLVNVEISGIRVSGQGFETDGIGSFVKTAVLVPQLQPGIHTVEALVQTQGEELPVSVRTSVEVADIVTRPSADAFEDIINNGTMVRAWNLDRETQTWSFFDPAPEFSEFNTLNEVSTGQIVTVIMNAQDTFQGQTLFEGSNPIAME